jgi:hypothetical protein
LPNAIVDVVVVIAMVVGGLVVVEVEVEVLSVGGTRGTVGGVVDVVVVVEAIVVVEALVVGPDANVVGPPTGLFRSGVVDEVDDVDGDVTSPGEVPGGTRGDQ